MKQPPFNTKSSFFCHWAAAVLAAAIVHLELVCSPTRTIRRDTLKQEVFPDQSVCDKEDELRFQNAACRRAVRVGGGVVGWMGFPSFCQHHFLQQLGLLKQASKSHLKSFLTMHRAILPLHPSIISKDQVTVNRVDYRIDYRTLQNLLCISQPSRTFHNFLRKK